MIIYLMNDWHLDLNLKMLPGPRACSDFLSLNVSFFMILGWTFCFFINSYIPPPLTVDRYPNIMWGLCQCSTKHIASLSNRKPGLKRNDKLLEQILCPCYFFFLFYFLLEFCVAPRSHFLTKAWYNKNLRLCVKCYWLQALEFS